MTVKMKYINFESKSIKSLWSKKKIGSVSLPIVNKMNSMSNKIAFMPNFIHSMDSTNIQMLVKFYLDLEDHNKVNLFTVHDCFATSPDKMNKLNKDIRNCFVMIYFEKDYIKSLHQNFIIEIYKNVKRFYIKKNNKLEEISINDIYEIDFYQEYIIKLDNKKEYTIPSLPYKLEN
jgi:DNA-directed RNA polymerase